MNQDIPASSGDEPAYSILLKRIERETGIIPDAVKALLITDGSVTTLLECFSGSPVSIRTISQKVVPASDALAEEMKIPPGDPVNHRVVGIYDQEMDIPLIHAISYCPVHRLPAQAQQRLMQADIPIGHILRDAKMESRREITNIRLAGGDELPAGFSCRYNRGRVFTRKYRIIHQNLPLFRIEEFVPDDIFPGTDRVEIRTPSRLHLTLIDMNGSLGRVDGGIGITLDRPGYLIRAEPAEEMRVISDDADLNQRVQTIIATLAAQHDLDPDISVQIREEIPMHNGLGSGTQLSLAVATAMQLLSQQGEERGDPAHLTGRGGTSGIGVQAFSTGGVILDGGHRFGPGKEKDSFLPSSAACGIRPAPLIGRYEFPEDWRVILCLPDIREGASGMAEKNIFERCCPVPITEVRELSHIILMQMIPALLDQDLDQFGSAVSALRHLGFKREEFALQPPVLHDILDFMTTSGAAGAGMSSFGPALYALTDTNGASLTADIRSYLHERCGGEVMTVKGRNRGALIRTR